MPRHATYRIRNICWMKINKMKILLLAEMLNVLHTPQSHSFMPLFSHLHTENGECTEGISNVYVHNEKLSEKTSTNNSTRLFYIIKLLEATGVPWRAPCVNVCRTRKSRVHANWSMNGISKPRMRVSLRKERKIHRIETFNLISNGFGIEDIVRETTTTMAHLPGMRTKSKQTTRNTPNNTEKRSNLGKNHRSESEHSLGERRNCVFWVDYTTECTTSYLTMCCFVVIRHAFIWFSAQIRCIQNSSIKW